MGETPNEFQLKNPPNDGISSVKFGPNSSQFLLVSSWDSTVRLYDIVANNKRMEYFHSAPVLDCCFHVRFAINTGGVIHEIHIALHQLQIILVFFIP